MTNQRLGKRLRDARKACGLTQEAVSQKLGVSRPTITQMELGNRAITSIELERLATLYGCDINDFFDNSEDVLAGLPPPITEALKPYIVIAQQITNLETLLNLRYHAIHYTTAVPNSKWKAICEGEMVANQERSRLRLDWAPVPFLAQILEMQGIRTFNANLPPEISGLTINHPNTGPLIAVNSNHPPLQRRFSLAHEYAHVLFDHRPKRVITHTPNLSDPIEIRANSFAAAFLIPQYGIHQFFNSIGKCTPNHCSHILQLYDVAHLAHYFGVSRPVALSRLRNLHLLSQSEFDRLHLSEEQGERTPIANLLTTPNTNHDEDNGGFQRRILHLGLEAYRRKLITLAKLEELAKLISMSDAQTRQLVKILNKEA